MKTIEEARVVARREVEETGWPRQIWRHVGGTTPAGRQVTRGTYLVRDARLPAPRWACWELQETIEP